MKVEKVNYDLPGQAFVFACRIVMLCKILDKKPGVSRALANLLVIKKVTL